MSQLTAGWLARHTPQTPGGRYVALSDNRAGSPARSPERARHFPAPGVQRWNCAMQFVRGERRTVLTLIWTSPCVSLPTTPRRVRPAAWGSNDETRHQPCARLPPDERGWIQLAIHTTHELPTGFAGDGAPAKHC